MPHLLPETLIRGVWSRIPYRPRQTAYRILRRKSYRDLKRLATSVVDGRSLKPFWEHQCIFVHIPKTGGVSVSMSLFGHLTAHMPLRNYQILLDRADFERFFKFTVVRNPWDRLVSAYTYLRTGETNADDQRWAREHLARYADFGTFVRKWINRKNVRTRKHFVPQFEFLALTGIQPGTDFVGHFEHLQRDYALVRKRLSIPSELKHLNASKRAAGYRDYYAKDTVEIVADVYWEDIELFGYVFDNDFASAPE